MEKYYVSNKAVLVNIRGEILMLELHDGRLDFPGGRMEKDEDTVDCLAREVYEETRIKMNPKKARPFFASVLPYRGPPPFPVLVVVYAVPVDDVEVTLSEEHGNYFWIDPRKFYKINGDIGKILDAYRDYEGILVDTQIKKIRQGLGLVSVYTGNGKGKTTAALGVVLRARGAGKKIGIVFFDKGGNHYCERRAIDTIEGIEYVVTGRDRIDPRTGQFDFSIQEIDKLEARRGQCEVLRMFKKGFDLVILDEINPTVSSGILSVESVLSVLDAKPDSTELVLTGRNAPVEFLDRADLVTEMLERKHYFYSCVKAREGIDY